MFSEPVDDGRRQLQALVRPRPSAPSKLARGWYHRFGLHRDRRPESLASSRRTDPRGFPPPLEARFVGCRGRPRGHGWGAV